MTFGYSKTTDNGNTWSSPVHFTNYSDIVNSCMATGNRYYLTTSNLWIGAEILMIDGNNPVEVSSFETALNVNALNQYSLERNYPNPFNPSTKIKYYTPAAGNVSLKVYNILGTEQAVLVNEYSPDGFHEVEFDAGKYGLSSGVYFCKMIAENYSSVIKIVLAK